MLGCRPLLMILFHVIFWEQARNSLCVVPGNQQIAVEMQVRKQKIMSTPSTSRPSTWAHFMTTSHPSHLQVFQGKEKYGSLNHKGCAVILISAPYGHVLLLFL